MKKTVKKNIVNLRKYSSSIPKTINEAISFGQNPYEEDDDMEPEDDEMGGPMGGSREGGANVENFIANMRKESLAIMHDLADDPDDAVYQFAKKIFQLADKAHEDQKEGKDINGQQPGQGQMQQRQM